MKEKLHTSISIFIFMILLLASYSVFAQMTVGTLQPWGPTNGEGWLLLPRDEAIKIIEKGYIATGWDSNGDVVQRRMFKKIFGTIDDKENGKKWLAISFGPVIGGYVPNLDLSGIDAAMYADLSVAIAAEGRKLGWVDGHDMVGAPADPGRGRSSRSIHYAHAVKPSTTKASLKNLIYNRLSAIKQQVNKAKYDAILDDLKKIVAARVQSKKQ